MNNKKIFNFYPYYYTCDAYYECANILQIQKNINYKIKIRKDKVKKDFIKIQAYASSRMYFLRDKIIIQ